MVLAQVAALQINYFQTHNAPVKLLASLRRVIENSWYVSNPVVTLLLLPLSVLYGVFMFSRYWLWRFKPIEKLPVPVIVVGNLTVGGTGKTPVVMALCDHLQQRGYHPGVIARGYLGRAKKWPKVVSATSSAREVGDEAVLIAQSCHCPVMAGPRRVRCAKKLISEFNCNVLVSDDGLQHLALDRDLEIALVDGQRRFGNGLFLPAGPLRERMSRLSTVDIVVVTEGKPLGLLNEFSMQLLPVTATNLKNPQEHRALQYFIQYPVHAVAGIGNNQRFFNLLKSLGLRIIEHAFPDHFAYQAENLDFKDQLPVLMTEKDAVKCREFAVDRFWMVTIEAVLSKDFYNSVDRFLERRKTNG